MNVKMLGLCCKVDREDLEFLEIMTCYSHDDFSERLH